MTTSTMKDEKQLDVFREYIGVSSPRDKLHMECDSPVDELLTSLVGLSLTQAARLGLRLDLLVLVIPSGGIEPLSPPDL